MADRSDSDPAGAAAPWDTELATAAAGIRARRPSIGRTRLVAVDGPGGAGKSTVAGELAAALTAPLVGTDDFYVPMDGDPLAWYEPFAAGVLTALRAGRDGAYTAYDWRRGRPGGPVIVPAAPVVLVEGVGAACVRMAGDLAYAIWVDTPTAVAVARTDHRDGPELAALWARWRVAERAHFAADRTAVRADQRITGTGRGDG